MAYFHRFALPVSSDQTEQCVARRGGRCDDDDAYDIGGFCRGVSASHQLGGWKQCVANIDYRVAPSPLGDVELITNDDIVGDASRFSVLRLNAELP